MTPGLFLCRRVVMDISGAHCHPRLFMLTSAITTAIVAVLTWIGVEPGLYIAGVWLGVKIVVVGTLAIIGIRAARRRRLGA